MPKAVISSVSVHFRSKREKDFNRTIEIVEREAKRVNIFLDEANQNENAIIFCANQAHAALIRDLVNQNAKSKDPFYCVRVTANDGEEGERLLREFHDNEKKFQPFSPLRKNSPQELMQETFAISLCFDLSIQ